MNIALALSGGGLRATVFHLGVLARLAEENRLEDVNLLSTVSGGSLCAGMVFSLNQYRWPSSPDYLQKILPEARRLLTTVDLQAALVRHSLARFWTVFTSRADDLSLLMQKHWGIAAQLGDLPENPRWMINATCYETGKNWRFEHFRMGDYRFGYTNNVNIPLTDAMAASAGFPGLIGALTIDTTRFSWFRYLEKTAANPLRASTAEYNKRKTEPIQPPFDKVHLWDGGAYDNHGLEGVHDFITGWREGVDFLIVSDGAGRSKPEKYQPGAKATMRLMTGILMDQVRSLRSRAILERLINHKDQDRGGFLQIGNTAAEILGGSPHAAELNQLVNSCLPQTEAKLAADMPTVIRKLTSDEFSRLFRHGFEVADLSLYAYNDDQFGLVSFGGSRSAKAW
jgi:NTE family protein